MRLPLFLLALSILSGPCAAQDHAAPDTILIVTHTTGYRHDSIGPATKAIAGMGRELGLRAEITDDPARFDRSLDTVRVVALVSTTTRRNHPETEWLIGPRGAALQALVQRGGGILAIHGAADSHYGWDWYGRMIGARFARHPKGTPTGTLRRATGSHPALHGLPRQFHHADEWYWFANLDPSLRPLLTLLPASIGETGRDPHPVSWGHSFEGGQVFYTSLGHTAQAWADPRVLAHVRGGLRWLIKKTQDGEGK